MFDRDLTAWYRDLFLYPSPPRRSRQRHQTEGRAGARPAATGAAGGPQPKDGALSEGFAGARDSHWSGDHGSAGASR